MLRETTMFKRRQMFSATLVAVACVIILWLSATLASASEGLKLDYLISYKLGANSSPRVTIIISSVNATQIDLVISPMYIFGGKDQSLWLVDFQQIVATGEDGQQLPVSDRGITVEYYLEKTAQYRLVRVGVAKQSKVTIQYKLNRLVLTGFLETLLLRPRNHKLVEDATLRFELPIGWRAVTVLTKEQNGIFHMGSMDSFYGDNQNPIYNFVPAGFAVGEQKDIVEIETNCGRLIFAYSFPPINADSVNAELGKAIFEYYCTVVGPLAPYNAYIAVMSTEWNNIGGQPGLYPFYVQHNRTIDLSQSMPIAEYRRWEWKLCPNTPFFCDLPDYAYYGFPHKLLRAWFSTGGLVFMTSGPDWFFRGGISQYFQEMAMQFAFGQHKVYERFRDMYQYYQKNYVQTGLDRSLFSQSTDEKTNHFLSYFKSGLWAFYLNQRILEATHGEKSIADLSRYLYAKYAGIGRPLTYEEIKEAVNIVAGTDLSDVWSRYAYGDEPLPLDPYFQDDDKDGLMNGLEAERHTDPKSADSDGDGVDDSVEYATECMCVSLNPIYCTEVIPPNAKGNVPASPTTSIITNAPLSIVLDGISSDWPQISPLATDPREAGPYDFAALYAFSDENYLYLRIDAYGHFPSNIPGQFTFDIVVHGKSRLVFQAFTIPNQVEEVHLVPVVDNAPQFGLQKVYRGSALKQVFELVIPLAYLGYPERVTIHAYVNNVAGQPTTFDSFDFVEYTIK